MEGAVKQEVHVVPDVNIWVGLFQGKPGSGDVISTLTSATVHTSRHIIDVTRRVLCGLVDTDKPEVRAGHARRVETFIQFIQRVVADTGGSFDDSDVDYSFDGDLAQRAWKMFGTDLEDEAIISLVKAIEKRVGAPVILLTMDRALRSYCEDRKVLSMHRGDFLRSHGTVTGPRQRVFASA